MRLIISGRHLDITPAIRDYAEKKITKIKKYFDHIIEVDVTLSAEHSKSEGEIHTADVLLFANGTKIKATATDGILYAAIDEVLDVLENQVKKYKEKLKSRSHHKLKPKEILNEEEIKRERESEKDDVIIKGSMISPKPMDVEEAILQMKALEREFYAFMNHETEQLNVVHKRGDGVYGLIEPAWGKK